ncbi:MAG TPA: hypothetical protein VHO67_07850, partial [Polyangia bacterium]|nr:hypothetical protein [Polyangia bacterium]
ASGTGSGGTSGASGGSGAPGTGGATAGSGGAAAGGQTGSTGGAAGGGVPATGGGSGCACSVGSDRSAASWLELAGSLALAGCVVRRRRAGRR